MARYLLLDDGIVLVARSLLWAAVFHVPMVEGIKEFAKNPRAGSHLPRAGHFYNLDELQYFCNYRAKVAPSILSMEFQRIRDRVLKVIRRTGKKPDNAHLSRTCTYACTCRVLCSSPTVAVGRPLGTLVPIWSRVSPAGTTDI